MIYNLGSINIDYFYQVPHLPLPGETLAATDHSVGLGGKGANQSVAIARAGVAIKHIGAIGDDGEWTVERLASYGVDTTHISKSTLPTAHAIINVDPAGENAIVIYSGASGAQDPARINAALSNTSQNDILILQNETSHQETAARIAHDNGAMVVYSAAPFDMGAVRAVLPYITLLIVNEVEAAQLSAALDMPLTDIPVPRILITKGAQGAEWHDLQNGDFTRMDAFKVTPVDTTGAGDTFAGYVVAGLSEGMTPAKAMRLAAAASAIKVTHAGTADAIPARSEVDDFLKAQ
ncbi:MAG: ribokinase [Rhodobacterales bacterium]|nr:ribokinase [Rhodobacterales bacterium]